MRLPIDLFYTKLNPQSLSLSLRMSVDIAQEFYSAMRIKTHLSSPVVGPSQVQDLVVRVRVTPAGFNYATVRSTNKIRCSTCCSSFVNLYHSIHPIYLSIASLAPALACTDL